MNYQTYLFDWDGTLADTLSVWLEAYHQVFKAAGKEVSDEYIGQNILGNPNYWQKNGMSEFSEIISKQEQWAYAQLQDVRLIADALATLEKLKSQGKTLGIVTTTSRLALQNGLNKHDLNQYFSTLVCGDDVEKHKPDPEPVLLALENLGVGPEGVVFVGDTEKDILAGNAAGVDTILVHTPGYHDLVYKEEVLFESNPNAVMSSLKQLLG